MQYQYLTNAPLDEALPQYLRFLEDAGMALGSEEIPVQQALNRITAEAVYANICAPHYNACAMDGIALMAQKTFHATETTPVTLLEEDFIRVDTGDPLPAGCDCVVMIEDVIEQEQGISLYAAAAPWQHVRQVGEDVAAGDMILPSYTQITPAAMGAMLAGGVLKATVLKQPVVGIIPTGDEIVAPCENPKSGDIIEFNSTIFSGMLSQWGAKPVTYPIVKDDYQRITAIVRQAASACDMVLLCAGTSAGRDDNTTAIIQEQGAVLYHGIAIKPGKPAVLGRINSVPVLGIPGYPVSGIIVLEQIVKPVLFAQQKQPLPEAVLLPVHMTRRINSSLKYQEFIRATITKREKGGYSAVPLNRGAGVVTSFAKADCLLEIPQQSEGCEAGNILQARLLRAPEQIKRRVCIVGSHDPLIDQMADLLRIQDASLFVTSAHAGSMGGVMAVKRGEADMGGVHLLEEDTGGYNEAYVTRYFPEGGVALVECVQRVQGLMVAHGNPKGIRAFSDIANSGISYVNRQKGSGTRILCDYLAKQAGMDTALVYGYTREELTHTGVAAQIAAGSADVGLGIFSAAKIYGLDFIPICNEQYDLLVSLDAMEHEQVRAFLDVLKSPAFSARLERLGGYRCENPGRVRRIWEKTT